MADRRIEPTALARERVRTAGGARAARKAITTDMDAAMTRSSDSRDALQSSRASA
jgi:hypothetical protein